MIHDEDDFTVVDWESARRYGLPLWDLLYFLQDALLHLDGAAETHLRDACYLRLFRGEIESSRILFSWIRRAVDARSIAPRAVGPLVTLCWLHHGMSHLARNEAVSRHASQQTDAMPEAERITRVWLADRSLGWTWSAWT